MIDVATVFAAVAINIIDIKKFFAETSIFSLFIMNSSAAILFSETVLLNEVIIYDFDDV